MDTTAFFFFTLQIRDYFLLYLFLELLKMLNKMDTRYNTTCVPLFYILSTTWVKLTIRIP